MPDIPEDVREWARLAVDDMIAATLVPDATPIDSMHHINAEKNRVVMDLFVGGQSAEGVGLRVSALILEFALTTGHLVHRAAVGTELGPAEYFMHVRQYQDQIGAMSSLQQIALLEALKRQAEKTE